MIDRIDTIFTALANPTRREILRVLRDEGQQPVPKVKFSGIVQCEVLHFEVERSLCYSWMDYSGENDLHSTVTWRLEPEGQGTHLFLEHDGFDPAHPLLQLSYQIMSGGWLRLMRQLGELLASHTAG